MLLDVVTCAMASSIHSWTGPAMPMPPKAALSSLICICPCAANLLNTTSTGSNWAVEPAALTPGTAPGAAPATATLSWPPPATAPESGSTSGVGVSGWLDIPTPNGSGESWTSRLGKGTIDARRPAPACGLGDRIPNVLAPEPLAPRSCPLAKGETKWGKRGSAVTACGRDEDDDASTKMRLPWTSEELTAAMPALAPISPKTSKAISSSRSCMRAASRRAIGHLSWLAGGGRNFPLGVASDDKAAWSSKGSGSGGSSSTAPKARTSASSRPTRRR
mmetsp:Transcript_109466/g.233958  ORF Transcript_109466/g.233958 Transcript_109466/m.233958 type:complete len:276 (-) Transcript_109466:138-965(-)